MPASAVPPGPPRRVRFRRERCITVPRMGTPPLRQSTEERLRRIDDILCNASSLAYRSGLAADVLIGEARMELAMLLESIAA